VNLWAAIGWILFGVIAGFSIGFTVAINGMIWRAEKRRDRK